jgi:hypothetical protein
MYPRLAVPGNADAGLKQLTNGKNVNDGLTFFKSLRHLLIIINISSHHLTDLNILFIFP